VLSALLTLARPRLLPFVLFLPVVGFGWAHWDRALPLADGDAERLLAVLAGWAFLQAGTMWLNAALDRDAGEVLLGRAVAVPPGITSWGLAALVLGVGLSFLAGVGPGVLALLCAALSVLYSHPRTAWKGHPWLGPLVNGAGYGLLSPLAGWAVVGVAPDVRSVVVWLLGGLGTLGCYFAAQAFQGEEDRARGYRTLVVTHGPAGAVLAARLCLGTGFLGGAVLAALGWLPRLCLVGLPLGLWIDRWLRRGGQSGEKWARGLALRLLVGALLAIALALVDYACDNWRGGPVAGLATARGRPPDVPAWARDGSILRNR
jgi:4-hydroxybenzoate polyprenyltransferase